MRLPMRQVVNVGNGLCRQKPFELLVGTEQKNRLCINVDDIQVPHPVHVGLVVIADDQPLHNFYGLSVFTKEHIVRQGTG